MSGTVVLVPILITAWPMIASAVTSAAVAAGFRIVREEKCEAGVKREVVEVSMDNMEVIAESLAHDDRIVVRRNDVEVTFSRDGRGHFKTCVEGNLAKAELKRIGEEMAGRVIQHYLHSRVSQELQNQGFVTLEEDQGPDESIRLVVRRFEE